MSTTYHKNQGPFFQILYWQYRSRWLMAIIMAALINSGLFLIMPALIRPDDVIPKIDKIVSMVNVIRLKRPEPPAERKKKKEPPPPKSKLQTGPREQAIIAKMPRLTLPFEINQRLPALTTDLRLPVAATGRLNLTGALDGVEMDQLDKPLTTLSRIPPVYPLNALRLDIEGWVKVRFLVDEKGEVGSISIIEAKPHEIFDKSVSQCVAKWRFRPGTVEGIPVKAWMETTIRFELN